MSIALFSFCIYVVFMFVFMLYLCLYLLMKHTISIKSAH